MTPLVAAARRRAPVLVALAACATIAHAERLPIASFTTAHGLVYDRVLRIVRDSHGFLWFCTSQGLSRFDGRNFRNFTASDGLPESVIDDLLEAADGTYWVATDGGGVARFDPRTPAPPGKRFTVYPVGDEHVTSEVSTLRQDRQGRIWAGTRGGLFRLEKGGHRFLRVTLDHPQRPDRALPVWALLEEPDGSFWIGHERGLTRLPPSGPPLHYAVAPFPGGDTVWSLVRDQQSRVWIGHENAIFVLYPQPIGAPAAGPFPWRRLMGERETALPDGSVRLPAAAGEAGRYSRAHGLLTDGSGSLFVTTDGHVWLANNGLTHFDGQRFRGYTTAHGLVTPAVKSLGEDVDGNVWIGTRMDGVMRLFRRGFVAAGAPGTPTGDLVSGFVEEEPGKVWAVVAPGQLRRYEGGSATTMTFPLPASAFGIGRPGPFAGILRDRRGEWWVGTAHGLYRFPAVAVAALPRARPHALYTEGDGLAQDAIGIVFEDRSGDMWVGHTTTGERVLSRWSAASGAFRAYGHADGLPPNRVSAMAQDGAGRLFVSFYEGGVARQNGDRFELLPGLDPVEVGSVSALHVDAAGRLWIATSRGGLRRLDDTGSRAPRLAAYSVAEGLASNAVRALTEDRWGRLYAATLGGVDCLDPSLAQPLRRFTRAHGLANLFFEAAFHDSSGRLWFGTVNGIARLAPERWALPRPPLVVIDGLRVSGVPQPVADLGQAKIGPLSLRTAQDTIEIDFLTLDFGGEPRLFQYRLAGKQDWSAPSPQSRVTYAQLGPGRYTFQVRALGAGGQASDPPAEVVFSIARPLWARWWVQVLALAAVAALAYTAYRLRVARLVALERVRTRIAADLHDDIGSSLSQIAILTELARRQLPADGGAAAPLDRVAESSRELVDDMSDIVWAINPRRDRLGDLFHRMRRFASDTLTARDIAFTFSAPESEGARPLGADFRRQVLLVFKEAVHNLARHSGCGRAKVDVRLEHDVLTIVLSDDGQGFDPAAESQGHGLNSMRERARALGGELDISSAPGTGTSLTLTVPLGRRRFTFLPA